MSVKALTPWRLDAVSAEAMKTWADVLGDANPIHLDPEVAAALGFGSHTVNQGPANLAYVMNMMADNFPGAAITSVEAQFRGNVLSGDAVEAAGQGAITPQGIACDATLVRGHDEVVLTVHAEMHILSSESESHE